jgi:hypothetical protein
LQYGARYVKIVKETSSDPVFYRATALHNKTQGGSSNEENEKIHRGGDRASYAFGAVCRHRFGRLG